MLTLIDHLFILLQSDEFYKGIQKSGIMTVGVTSITYPAYTLSKLS